MHTLYVRRRVGDRARTYYRYRQPFDPTYMSTKEEDALKPNVRTVYDETRAHRLRIFISVDVI